VGRAERSQIRKFFQWESASPTDMGGTDARRWPPIWSHAKLPRMAAFSRERRAGTRTITISSAVENREMSVSAVSSVSANCHEISLPCGQ
jgi:NADPH-dependent ferric siderophore reductase